MNKKTLTITFRTLHLTLKIDHVQSALKFWKTQSSLLAITSFVVKCDDISISSISSYLHSIFVFFFKSVQSDGWERRRHAQHVASPFHGPVGCGCRYGSDSSSYGQEWWCSSWLVFDFYQALHLKTCGGDWFSLWLRYAITCYQERISITNKRFSFFLQYTARYNGCEFYSNISNSCSMGVHCTRDTIATVSLSQAGRQKLWSCGIKKGGKKKKN